MLGVRGEARVVIVEVTSLALLQVVLEGVDEILNRLLDGLALSVEKLNLIKSLKKKVCLTIWENYAQQY